MVRHNKKNNNKSSSKSMFLTFIPDIYIAPLQCPLLFRGTPDYSIDNMSEFHAEALQATMSEGLAQGP